MIEHLFIFQVLDVEEVVVIYNIMESTGVESWDSVITEKAENVETNDDRGPCKSDVKKKI